MNLNKPSILSAVIVDDKSISPPLTNQNILESNFEESYNMATDDDDNDSPSDFLAVFKR
jgi:hypothetical protein